MNANVGIIKKLKVCVVVSPLLSFSECCDVESPIKLVSRRNVFRKLFYPTGLSLSNAIWKQKPVVFPFYVYFFGVPSYGLQKLIASLRGLESFFSFLFLGGGGGVK